MVLWSLTADRVWEASAVSAADSTPVRRMGPGHEVDADAPAAGMAAEDRVELGAEVGGPLVDVGPDGGVGVDVQAVGVTAQQAGLRMVGEDHGDGAVGRGVG